MQKTKNITLNGDHRNYITLSLPEGVTYHDTAGKEQKGGSIKIYGGTTFYFTAEKTVHGTWNSGDLGGQVGAQWKTLVVSTGYVKRLGLSRQTYPELLPVEKKQMKNAA